MPPASWAANMSWDPLGYTAELPLEATFHPLGFELILSTNSRDIVTAAEESWRGFEPRFDAPAIRVRAAVAGDPNGECARTVWMRGQAHLLAMVSDLHNFAVCDLPGRFAYCTVTPATAANRAWFRYFYLETIANLMLWQSHLTRIHAACVARNGYGVLLCGESGAGKSCLAYACARRGWTFISDEAPSILRRTEERIVIGKPQQIHLREAAFELFPELAGRPVAPNPVGKISFELHTADLPEVRTAATAHIQALVWLNRKTPGKAALEPLDKEEASRRLLWDLPFFEPPAHQEHQASLRNMLGAEAYDLRYQDLDSAVALLAGLVPAEAIA